MAKARTGGKAETGSKTAALFDGFAKHIKKKHEHLGEYMLLFPLQQIELFFVSHDITGFGPGNLWELLESLDAGGGDAENIMLFQLLVDLCDFCTGKGIDLSAVKEHLLLEKTQILRAWQEEAFEEEEEVDAEDLLKDFDTYYPLIVRPAGKGKQSSRNIGKMADFIEKTHDWMRFVFEKGLEIREGNPGITEAEYLKLLEREYKGKRHGPPEVSADELRETSLSLPKEQLRKWIKLGIRIGDTEHLTHGTAEHREAIGRLLADMRGLAADLRKIQ